MVDLTLAVRNVVLVHGAFVDGSGWTRVHRELLKDGFNVSVVQNPITSLADDVAATRRAVLDLEGPVILVGHSYGGSVISQAGNDHKVTALVYVAAFVPDAGESVATLIANPPPGAVAPPITAIDGGYLIIEKSKFHEAFAADVGADEARFMADSQLPWGPDALAGVVSVPAWRSKPSWYVVATEDRMIPADAQRHMARRAGAHVIEVRASHAVYVSQPDAVVKAIRAASSSSVERSA